MMRLFLLLLVISVTLGCQNEKKDSYIIYGSTQGFEDGTAVYVNALSQSNRPAVIDSTIIKNGKFEIELPPVEQLDFNYLTFDKVSGNVLYLAENNPIQMTIYKDSLRSSKIDGGIDNDLFFEYVIKVQEFNNRRIDLNNQYQIAIKLKEGDKAKRIATELTEAFNQEKTFRKNIAEQNPNSIVSVMALTDLLNLKVIPAREIKELYTTVDASLKNTRLAKNLDQLIRNSVGRIDVGSEAVSFAAPSPDGTNISLNDAMGKLTIIDFWASWCKPCRIENPNVVRVYNKYHDKGLNIIGVSLDRDKNKWLEAIAADNLQWSHVSNLKFWQEPIAKLYGVRSIPATFLLDEDGKVIAKNLRGVALENKIAELLD
ncbi:redoxin domain-containing protein [Aquimarina sp. W85]|uniref:redoxin domain-containing protein n=1 Tax=Aquimarina rhodophyticola TaxID=3342246 RepID=UPI00366D29A0